MLTSTGGSWDVFVASTIHRDRSSGFNGPDQARVILPGESKSTRPVVSM